MFHSILVYRTGINKVPCIVGSVADLDWFPMRVQIQGIKLSGSGFWSWSDLAVTQSWISTWKLYFMRVICHKKIPVLCRYGTQAILKDWVSGLFVNFGHFLAPEVGFGSAFPIRIRSRRAKSKWIHANPDPDPKHWSYVSCTMSSFSKLPKR
jgi:hypothetical protein